MTEIKWKPCEPNNERFTGAWLGETIDGSSPDPIPVFRPHADPLRLWQENDRLRLALAVYADPRHWAYIRDDFDQPAVAWIGPGALKRYGLPDASETARAALDTGEESVQDSEPTP